ncbi:MAG: hypothetical protein VCA36_00905 [Opitutales bacterium]
MLRLVLAASVVVYFAACGSKPGPGPTPKPPWPDSPTPPSSGAPQTQTREKPPFVSHGNQKVNVDLIALGNVWVLVNQEGQNEIWKSLREGERLVVPKKGKMSVTYSSGKNLRIEAAGRMIKPSGGDEGVGFIDLD